MRGHHTPSRTAFATGCFPMVLRCALTTPLRTGGGLVPDTRMEPRRNGGFGSRTSELVGRSRSGSVPSSLSIERFVPLLSCIYEYYVLTVLPRPSSPPPIRTVRDRQWQVWAETAFHAKI